MKRGPAVALALLAGAAVGLYPLKHRVADLEDEADRLARAVADDRQAIRLLQIEWAYLNEPGRLAGIASRHLDLAPIGATATVALERLPRRAAGGEAMSAADEADP